MIPFDGPAVLLLILLGGAVAVDGTSFGQFMISRPLVAASLAGLVVGRPMQGALIGVVLEAFQLTILPVGAAKYPEGGPAAVAAGAVYAASDPASSTALICVLIALGLEVVGGESVRYLRQGNVYIISARGTDPLTPRQLERRHLAAIGLDYLRGTVLVTIGIIAISVGVSTLVPLWGLGERVPHILITAMVAGLLASTFRILGSHTWMTALGAAAGLAFLLLTA